MAVEVMMADQVDGMADLEPLLGQIVSDIEPTRAQKEGAQRSHNHLRALLDTGQIASRILNSYLSGSYARGTAIRPLDDVDIIFEIDPSPWKAGLILDSLPSPERVLDSFAAAIRRRYRLSSVYGQRRSVCLTLDHIDIDVVPAIPAAIDATLIRVPDRESGKWINSSPARHSQNATRVNEKRNGKFKPLVKLLKFWNSNLPDTARCKSFMIETIAVRVFSETAFSSLGHGLLLFWDFLASRYNEATVFHWTSSFGMSFGWFSVSVPDAAGTGSNTAARARFDDTRERAVLRALRA